jgi:hypothetical protein
MHVTDALVGSVGSASGAVSGALGGAVGSASDAVGGIYAAFQGFSEDWVTLTLAWLVVGYVTILLLVILAEACRCVSGQPAYGYDAARTEQKVLLAASRAQDAARAPFSAGGSSVGAML